MKTVVIWDQCGQDRVNFFVIDSDIQHLNNTYINSVPCDAEDESNINSLEQLLSYDENGIPAVDMLEVFPVEEVKAGAAVIVCGFIP